MTPERVTAVAVRRKRTGTTVRGRRRAMRAARRAQLLALALAAGCATPPAPPPPGPSPLVPTLTGHEVPDEPGPTPLLLPPSGTERVDALLASPILRDPEFADAVAEWVGYWSGAAAPAVPTFLGRMSRFEAAVDSLLEARDLPASLRYLPFIESGYNPAATSHAAAVGMWQFMAGTARGFGLEVTSLVDERRHPFKSTEAAIGYLEELHDEFGSWFLTLAAYNAGPTRTRRILRENSAALEPRTDSLFWRLREHFPRETREFIPKLLGAIVVASRPGAHGIEVRDGDRFDFDEVTVPDATTLDVVARAAGVSEAEIVELNPELVRGITPRARTFALRVPAGRGALFEERYALIPPEERVTFVEHVVAPGETLSHIARQYRVSVSDIRAANPEVRPRYLRIGARLTVPVAPSARSAGPS